MTQDEFNAETIKQINAARGMLIRLQGEIHSLQALCMALAEQNGIGAEKLEEDFEENLLLAVEQLAPASQHPESYQKFREGLLDRIYRGQRSGPK